MGRLAIDGCWLVSGWIETRSVTTEMLYVLTEPANTPATFRTGKRELQENWKKALTVPDAVRTFRLHLLQGGAAW